MIETMFDQDIEELAVVMLSCRHCDEAGCDHCDNGYIAMSPSDYLHSWYECLNDAPAREYLWCDADDARDWQRFDA